MPFGCFATTDGSSGTAQCANGQIIRTPQQWGDLVRAAYPGYTGPGPRMQIWHGTDDDDLRYPNFGEEIKQWTNVHGLSQTPTFTDTPAARLHPHPLRRHRRRCRRSRRSACRASAHNLPVDAAEAIRFFGLDSTGPDPSPPPTTPTTAADPRRPRPPPTRRPRRRRGGCRVSYDMNAWNTGLTTSRHHHQHRAAPPINGWELAFTLPTGQTITSGWNATYSPTSGAGDRPERQLQRAPSRPDGSVTIGFQANHTGNTGSPPRSPSTAPSAR